MTTATIVKHNARAAAEAECVCPTCVEYWAFVQAESAKAAVTALADTITTWWNDGTEYLVRLPSLDVLSVHDADVDTSDGPLDPGDEAQTFEGMTFTVLLNRSDLHDELVRLGFENVASAPLPSGLAEELAAAINTAGPCLHRDDVRQGIADWCAEY